LPGVGNPSTWRELGESILEPISRAFELGAIHVQPDQATRWADAFEKLDGVAPMTDRAIDRDLARLGPQSSQHLLDHDRYMRPRGRSALSPHVLLHLRIRSRIKFFVLLIETLGMRARIPRPPPPWPRRS
jgi:hypothetical protein